MSHDVTTSLRSDIAALQYKRDRLLSELQEMKGQLRSRDQRALELQVETEQLREQAARQNAVIASLKKRIQDLEERERNLTASQGRAEMAMQTLQRENRYQEEKIKDLEKKVHSLELECNSEEALKEAQRKAMQDLVRRLSSALGTEYNETILSSPDGLIHKASELVQETSRLRTRSSTVSDTLSAIQTELRTCREALERAVADRDSLQRQAASHLLELDRLRQEKDTLEMQQRVAERDVMDLRDKLSVSNRSLGLATDNIASQEASICQLKEDVKLKEEKLQRLQNELRHLLESLAIQLSSPVKFVETQEGSIQERLREVIQENKDRLTQVGSLQEKVAVLTQKLNRHCELQEQATSRARAFQDEKTLLESQLHKTERDLNATEISRDGLRRDKTTFMTFLERLGRAFNMEEISKEIGVDLHTESLLIRAEQLARLESDKLIDKSWWTYRTFPQLRREHSFHELPLRETSAVYQLQRRVRTLREQLQRRDLHLDLLRRKLSLQEDNGRIRSLLETERDEANLRVKKLLKQVDRLQLQLAEVKAHSRDLKTQLADASDYKISALERGRKVEELQKRLVESEMLRTRYNRKVALLKDQVRTTSQTVEQERSLNDHSVQLLRDELGSVKQTLSDCQRRENALLSFRTSVGKLLGTDGNLPDYELIARLQKLVHAHRDFTLVSRRYDDPLLLRNSPPVGGTRTPMMLGPSPGGSRTPHYDDSGFVDPPDLSTPDDSDDVNGIYNKRPIRTST
ncbi:coiled-coil domain-containing protein 170 isoform X3 [Zootermopsis nevadensis]|nr:coiled-coil domain-containing protein 170 isoform X3 [Zootermopsis nevadensis]XP_021937806.1 coiled-coil domain-containing protein 170 isoform X3 [Zootermopsis nevadensis]XP_021937808.1 coiled-coil domain-containing protein 170 isoform X3 [Zootermopsis nevadensis]XP_021937809.1 coiled-coil domain-containing protein 170 isoform X3 [Zootermopsis nevadensis]XP_021937810.1 coiled-coil domain-containing protein 170 isoform X3 [Zootermopsis nevadensis]